MADELYRKACEERKPMEQSETTITVPVTLPKPPENTTQIDIRSANKSHKIIISIE
jgi:hypothetical protein